MIPTLDSCAPYVAPQTIDAVIRVESNGNPLAVNVNGVGSFSPPNLNQAIAIASYFIRQGHRVDLGLMQVDSENLQALGQTVQTIFDPCANIAAGSSILSEDFKTALEAGMAGQDALDSALSAYNTGNLTAGFYNGYVAKYHFGNSAGKVFSNRSPAIENTTLYSRTIQISHAEFDGTTLYKREK